MKAEGNLLKNDDAFSQLCFSDQYLLKTKELIEEELLKFVSAFSHLKLYPQIEYAVFSSK